MMRDGIIAGISSLMGVALSLLFFWYRKNMKRIKDKEK